MYHISKAEVFQKQNTNNEAQTTTCPTSGCPLAVETIQRREERPERCTTSVKEEDTTVKEEKDTAAKEE